jgi:hypothetical protein
VRSHYTTGMLMRAQARGRMASLRLVLVSAAFAALVSHAAAAAAGGKCYKKSNASPIQTCEPTICQGNGESSLLHADAAASEITSMSGKHMWQQCVRLSAQPGAQRSSLAEDQCEAAWLLHAYPAG